MGAGCRVGTAQRRARGRHTGLHASANGSSKRKQKWLTPYTRTVCANDAECPGVAVRVVRVDDSDQDAGQNTEDDKLSGRADEERHVGQSVPRQHVLVIVRLLAKTVSLVSRLPGAGLT